MSSRNYEGSDYMHDLDLLIQIACFVSCERWMHKEKCLCKNHLT